jgi:flagellar assembly protein FliH
MNMNANAVSLWDLPEVSGEPVQARRAGKTVAEIEEVERQAYEEAYAKGLAAGHAAGLAAGKAEYDKVIAQAHAQVERLAQIIDSLAKPLEDVDAQVETELTNLALTVARQLVRRELRVDPAQVIAIIRETIALLPAAARDVRVHLHPEDAAVVRERLAEPATERAWRIVEDPVMTRGGCRVTTEHAQVDARLETRINEVIATILGDERSVPRGSDANS